MDESTRGPIFDGQEGRLPELQEEVVRLRSLLAAREARSGAHEQLFEYLSDGIVLLDGDFIVRYANPAAGRLFGKDPACLIGRTLRQECPYAPAIEERCRLAIETGEPAPFEQVCKPHPEPLWFEAKAYPLPGDIFAVHFRDITGQKHIEEQLRQKAEELEQLMDVAPAAIWVSRDPLCAEITGNRLANAFYEAGEEENLSAGPASMADTSLGPRRFFNADGRELSAAELPMQYAATHNVEISNQELEVLLPSGGSISILASAKPLHDSERRVRGAVGASLDITARKRAEAALRVSESQFRQIADSMPQLVWVAGTDGYHEWHNRQWHDYTGLNHEQSVRYGWLAVVHPEEKSAAAEAWRQSLKAGEPYETQFRCRRADGVYRWMLGRALPIRDEKQRVVRWFGTFTDIHGQKSTEEALRRSNEDLQQFAYVASHDLQEPLRTVVSFSQILSRRYGDKLDAQADTYLSLVIRAGLRMSSLIGDLLAYSRATSDAGADHREVNLAEVLTDVLSAMQTSIEENRAEITSNGLPVVLGDRAQLSQVLQNLVSNAIKYRRPEEPPQIEITCERRLFDWLITVRDNGQGFEQEYAERIFGIFKRLHGHDVPGTGIGLAISKTIVERHGGRIWADSIPGRGSVFSFTLPVPDGHSE